MLATLLSLAATPSTDISQCTDLDGKCTACLQAIDPQREAIDARLQVVLREAAQFKDAAKLWRECASVALLDPTPDWQAHAWLDMHATEDAPIAGVYALFEREQCVFVGTGMDAVAALREVRSELGDNVTVKIEEHPPDQKGVLSLVYGSWLDEASPDGVRPRINAERAAERVARERGYYGT